MKIKKYKEKYDKKTVKKPIKDKKKVDFTWIIKIFITAFVISLAFSLVSELIIPNAFILVSVLLVLVFIFLGVLFDMIGISVTAADDKMFHSMAAKRVFGAKTAIKLIKNTEKVSSFCNDVIGDICGVISGSCGIAIALKLATLFNLSSLLMTLLITALIAALTIGGKAIGKGKAVNSSNHILYGFAKFVAIFTKDK